MYKKILLGVLVLAAAFSCQKTPQVVVNASFTTDKDTYEVFETIQLANTTTVENSRMAICKWEWNGKVSYDEVPEGISFDKEGVYPLTLTVTSEEGAVKGTYTKDITVIDSNVKPVVDFEYSPAEIIAGEEVQFTDKSTDSDGIASWEWTFGTTVVNEQNPVYVFKETGDIMVTLKVTDNRKGSSSKTITVSVGRGVNYLDLMWEKSYDNTADAHVYGTSPAVSPDGSRIYVHSTGYHLVAFDPQGNELWSFDTSVEGASALNNSGSIKNQSPTPSVDEDGNVFIPVGFDEPKQAYGGLFCITPDGSRNWYTSYGLGAAFRFMSPMIFGDYVATNQRNTGQGEAQEFNKQNFVILNRKTGALVSYHYCNGGPYGGLAAMEMNGSWLLFANSQKNGTCIYYPEAEGVWYANKDVNLVGSQETLGSQMAVSADGRLYSIYKDKTLYCHDMSSYTKDMAVTPAWTLKFDDAEISQNGLGCVIGEDGTVYVTFKNGLHAVNPDGTLKWSETPDGTIHGVAAVDNAGAIYYNDSKTGKLIKLTPEGKRVVELTLADSESDGGSFRSSPTIAPDGTIYCTGIKGGKPTLFCVKGSATGHADSWSQLGANPSKTGVLK